jgi:hypothetical protein
MLTIKKNDLETNLLNLKSSSSFIPSLYFLMIIVLLGIVLKVGLSKISEQKKTLADIKSKQAILADKEKTLSQAKDNIIGIFYNPASIALPTENPVLVSFSEVKSLLDLYLLPIDGYSINIGGEVQDQTVVGTTALQVTVFGKMDQVLGFLKDLEKESPLVVVNKLNFSNQKDLLSVEITVNSFYSPFVASKSTVDLPLQKITDSEKNVLIELGNLKQPNFSNPSPNGPFSRENPFSSL